MKQSDSLSFWQILTSTLAAAIGVQTRANMKRDFSRGEVMQFVAAGILFTLLFVVTMIAIVTTVVANV